MSAVVRRGAWVRFGRWHRVPAIGLAFALVVTSPSLLRAQRFTCEEARALLVSADAPRLDRFSAASTIMGCGTVAPGVVASALRSAKPNSTADTVASILAVQTFDRRLVDSIRVMAVDSSESTPRRTFYLQLLARYALPGTVVDTEAASHGSTWVLHRNLIWGTLGSRPFGTLLILKEDRARIIATIAAMGRQDPDDGLRRLAALVAPELERLVQEADTNELYKRTWP